MKESKKEKKNQRRRKIPRCHRDEDVRIYLSNGRICCKRRSYCKLVPVVSWQLPLIPPHHIVYVRARGEKVKVVGAGVNVISVLSAIGRCDISNRASGP